MPSAGGGERHEPHQSDRTEERRDPRRAPRLHREQGEQDQHRQRNDISVQRRLHDLEALDRRQHRQRRRDHRVAVEQGGADHAERDHHQAASAERALRERHQGECAAFAVIVGAQQDDHIFDADDEDQRPHDERQDAEDDLLARRGIRPDRGQHRLRATHRAGSCRCRHRRRRSLPRVSAQNRAERVLRPQRHWRQEFLSGRPAAFDVENGSGVERCRDKRRKQRRGP